MRVLFVIALTTLVSLLSNGQPLEEERDTSDTGRPTTSTYGEPGSQLEEPPMLRDEATSSNVDQASQEAEMCSRCYDKIKLASDLLALYNELLNKQKRLIKQRKKAAEAAAAAAAVASALPRSSEDAAEQPSRSPKNPRSAPPTTSSSTSTTTSASPPAPTTTPKFNSTGLRMRSLEAGVIVVHRLRVARSPATAVEQYDRNRAAYSKLAGRKDLELEKLKHEQQAKKEALCIALQEARDCLTPMERQCLGDLNYHTNELFVDQSFAQYRCPFPNSRIKPLPWIRTIYPDDQLRLPYARPDSSDKTVRERMHEKLPNWAPFGQPTRRLPGVMLTPTKNLSRERPQLLQQQQQPAPANMLRPRHEPQLDTLVSWVRVPAILGCGLAITLLLMVAWYELK